MKRNLLSKGVILLLSFIIFLAVITLTDAFGFALILIVLGVAGVTLIYSLVSQMRTALKSPAHRLYTKDFSFEFTATLMGFFLVLGTLLYIYVFRDIASSDAVMYTIDEVPYHVRFNNAEYFLRSLICSLDLFMLDVDSNILDRLDGHEMLKAWISIQAVLSFSCTVIMLVGLVYSRLRAYFKLAYRTKIDPSHNHLYLFFGINKPSEILVKDIVRNDPNAVVVFIDEANVKEDDTNEWEGIVGLITHKHKTFEIADKYAVRVAIASKSLSEIDEDVTSLPQFDAFGYLGLMRISKLIDKLRKVDDAQLHLFFLDENEEKNIRDIVTLAKDHTIKTIAAGKVMHRIYCHARVNGPNRMIQDVAVKNGLDIKIIDSSHLAVERLKLLPEYHPIHVASVDPVNPATVNESFDALIVGFGEVGRDAFRFLYEFGAFIDSSAEGDVATRSPFRCTIVDKNLDAIKGSFMASMPGIFENAATDIAFHSIDYNSEEFFTKILAKDKVRNFNYVVISIGDNDEAIALASRIFNRFRQYGGDLGKLMILVRCTDDTKVETVKKIADHYNHGYGDGDKNRPVIRIFGQPEETYTFELIISNRFIELGKLFHENYRSIKKEGSTWDERHNAATRTPFPKIDTLRKLRRQESQDLANALHAQTKMEFMQRALEQPLDWQMFQVRYFTLDSPNRVGHKAEINYPELTPRENLIVKRLAMLEHLRWNAAHELLGYVTRTDGVAACDELTMRHNCLKSWMELDAESAITESSDWPSDYKEYDFAVVDTTIAMFLNQQK